MDYADAIQRALRRFEEWAGRAPSSGEVRAAVVQVEELRTLAVEQRIMVVQHRRKFQTLAVADRLLWVAQDDAAEDPRLALGWLDTLDALLDLDVFDRDDFEAFHVSGLTVRTQALRAVTFAKMGRHHDAEVVLQVARYMDSGDILAEAELEESCGLVAAMRQRLEAAREHFGAARRVYESLQDTHLMARVDLRHSFACGESRLYGEAIDLALAGCADLDERREPRLLLAGLFNLARYLKDAGRIDSAVAVVARARPIFSAIGRRTDHLRLVWFEAGLTASQGHWREAVELYRRALDGFAALDQVFEVSAIAIEAADAFQSTGVADDAIRLLEVAVATMHSDGAQVDVIAATIALRDAMARRAATAALFAAARAQIERLG